MESGSSQCPRQAVVFDLDGTLLDSRKRLSAANEACVRRLLGDSRWLVIFATARPPRACLPLLGDLLQGAQLLCYNGAQVFRNRELVSETLIPSGDVRRFVMAMQERHPGLACGFERDDELYASGSFEHHFPRIFFKEMPAAKMPFADSAKILADAPDEASARSIVALLPDTCHHQTTDGGKLLQIMARGVSKRTATETVLRSHGLGFGQCLCFGDDLNDADLFEVCGRSVAMANAHPAVKALATDHTRSNDEDGVACFLTEQLGLRPGS